MSRALNLSPASRGNLADEVAKQLADAILANQLEHGAQLPAERELAKRLDVSRIVVREALKQLGERGLIEVRPGVGTFVMEMAPQAVTRPFSLYIQQNRVRLADLFQLRAELEASIAFYAALNAGDDDLTAMEENLRRTEALVEGFVPDNDSVEAFAWMDLEFHQLLSKATGNPLYEVILQPLLENLLQIRRDGARIAGTVRRAYDGHMRIYRHVLKADADTAVSAMRRHLGDVASWLRFEESAEPKAAGTIRRPAIPPFHPIDRSDRIEAVQDLPNEEEGER